jgi:hypothetical protein
MESKCFRVTVVPYRRRTDWRTRSTGPQRAGRLLDALSRRWATPKSPKAHRAPLEPTCGARPSMPTRLLTGETYIREHAEVYFERGAAKRIFYDD